MTPFLIEQLPRSVSVGVTQGGALRGGSYTQMLQLSLAAMQTLDNLAQALGLGQLAEQHRHELVPTTEPLGTLLSVKAFGSRSKLMTVDQRKDLAEQAGTTYHGNGLRGWVLMVRAFPSAVITRNGGPFQRLFWTGLLAIRIFLGSLFPNRNT
ncbi:MAG TPA: hypothetical protein VL486_06215 [Verrucomicrobiae bacterium]|nr:hypothetical protein [Verrucomicrobiae bacterium]